jgi:hypothetical protein
MYRIIAIVIGIAFLAYGLLRIGVGSAMLGHELGIFDIDALQEPIEEVGEFLEEKADKQLISATVGGYVGYIALMGLTLSIGAIGSLTNKRFGLPLIATFLLMYAALFINFQTINPKIVHLAVAAVLFLLLLWIKKREHA